jgi:hypothetical protein
MMPRLAVRADQDPCFQFHAEFATPEFESSRRHKLKIIKMSVDTQYPHGKHLAESMPFHDLKMTGFSKPAFQVENWSRRSRIYRVL